MKYICLSAFLSHNATRANPSVYFCQYRRVLLISCRLFTNAHIHGGHPHSAYAAFSDILTPPPLYANVRFLRNPLHPSMPHVRSSFLIHSLYHSKHDVFDFSVLIHPTHMSEQSQFPSYNFLQQSFLKMNSVIQLFISYSLALAKCSRFVTIQRSTCMLSEMSRAFGHLVE